MTKALIEIMLEEYATASTRLVEKALASGDAQMLQDVKFLMDFAQRAYAAAADKDLAERNSGDGGVFKIEYIDAETVRLTPCQP